MPYSYIQSTEKFTADGMAAAESSPMVVYKNFAPRTNPSKPLPPFPGSAPAYFIEQTYDF